MIEKMDRYSWILLSGQKDSFMDFLSSLGVIDITRSSKPVDSHSQSLLDRMGEIDKEIKIIECGENEETAELLNKIRQLEAESDAASVWGEFDPSKLAELKEAGIQLCFYNIPIKKFKSEWEKDLPIVVIAATKAKVWFVSAGPVDLPALQIAQPARSQKEINSEIEILGNKLERMRNSIKSRNGEIPGLKSEMDKLRTELDIYLASLKGESAAEDTLTVFEGFAPGSERIRLCESFDSLNLCYICEEASTEDNPPIKLRNNKFVSLFEPLTDMYGRPKYDGFDPTPFISIFFLLFFAMCMGDMGYGILLFAISFLLRKSSGLSKFAPLVSILGVGTIVIGFVFHTFFSIDFYDASFIPQWVRAVMVPPQIAGYDGTMILSLVIGVAHLCLAMVVKTVNETRNKGFIESLGTWGWTILFVGAVIVGVFFLAGVIDKQDVRIALVCIGVVCAAGIFPLNNIHRNPLKNVGSGLWDTYNMATGILGDVLSYLRLYALGLAGAMLGFAFNDLAKMALGDGGFGWIAFILIVLVGHTLNLAMAALGAFVHPLRLNFLEFFKNSGYDGSGKKYNPLKKQQ